MAQPPVRAGALPPGPRNVVQDTRTRPSLVTPEMIRERDADAYSGLADAYRIGWIGQAHDFLERELGGGDDVPGYDPFDHVPDGYEAYADAFARARSDGQVDVIRRQIDENLAVRARREERGFGSTLLSDLVASVFDPTNLVGGAEVRGAGALRGALMTSASVGTVNAVTELVRHNLDATSTREETAAAIAGGFVLPAFIGAGVGRAGRRAQATPVGRSVTQQIRMPVDGEVRITSGMGPRSRPTAGASTNHRGVDIGGALNQPIKASLDGEVIFAGRRRGFGNVVEIDHGGGLVTRYAHLNRIDVQRGARISQGAVLGGMGRTGTATGVHLHWEARINGRAVDPRTIGQRTVQAVDGGAGGVAGPAGTLAALEGYDPPSHVDLDARSARLVFGPTGRTDAEGNPVLVTYEPGRATARDPAGIGTERVTPDHPAAIARLSFEATATTRAPSSPDNVTVRFDEAPLRAPEPVAAEARLATIEDGDFTFFSSLSPGKVKGGAEALADVAERGLHNVSLKTRAVVARVLAPLLKADPERAADFFGDEVKVTQKAIEARIAQLVKDRVTIAKEGRVPTIETEIAPTSRDFADVETIQRRLDAGRAELARLETRMLDPRTGAKERAGLDARYQDLESALQMLEDQLTPIAGDWVRGLDDAEGKFLPAARDADPLYETVDDAFADLKLYDADRARLDAADRLREAADNTTSERVARTLRRRADAVEKGELTAEDAWTGINRPRSSPDPAKLNEAERHAETAIDDDDRAVLAEAYGRESYDAEAQRRLVDDVATAAARGIEAVSERVRAIVRKVLAAMLAAAIVFNPAGLRGPFADGGEAFARTVSIADRAEAPKGVDLSPQARTVYENVAAAAREDGHGFIIADKPGGQLHVFDREGRHIVSSPALYGRNAGDVAGPGATPAGTFRLAFGDYVAGGRVVPEMGRAADLVDPATGQKVHAGDGMVVAVHRVVLSHAEQRRAERLDSEAPDDNRISSGCINTSQKAFTDAIAPNEAELEGGLIFVLPEDPARAAAAFPAHVHREPADEMPSLPGHDDDGMPAQLPGERRAAMQREGGRRRSRDPWRNGHSEAPEWDGSDEAIVVDLDGVAQVFDSKPWVREGLPEDAFKRPADYANYLVTRERERLLNPQRDGEEGAAYEARLTKRAMQEIERGRRPLSPEDGRLKRLAVRPTPRGQLMAMELPDDAQIWREIDALAGDYGTTTAGGIATPGGSVFQRTLRWVARSTVFRYQVRRQWLAYLGKSSPESGKAAEAAALLHRARRTAQAEGKMPLPEFRNAVGRAIISETADVPAEARAAAKEFVATMRDFEAAMKQVGLVGRKLEEKRAAVRQRIAGLEESIAGAKALPEDVVARVNTMLDDWRNELKALDEEADQLLTPKRDPNYFTRIWHVGNMKRDRERVLGIFTSYFERQGFTAERAARQAKETFDHIVDEGGFHELGPQARPNAARHRSLDIANEEVWDFIVQDPELIMSLYARRMGSAIEMTRRYGDPIAYWKAEEIRADLLLRGIEPRKVEKAMQIWHDARDRVAGGFHGKDPLSWDNRTARAIKNFTNLVTMGRALYSQVSDVVRAFQVVGPRPMMKSLVSVMQGDLARFGVGPYAKAAGEALDLVLARTVARMIDADDFLAVTNETFLERGLANLQAPFFALNGMMPFSIIMKEWSSLASGHILLEEAGKVARALQAGEDADEALLKRLAANGIDGQDAQLLASMPIERTSSGLILANLQKWESERARDLFLSAVNGEVRRAVTTPGPLDRPRVMDGAFFTRKGREEGLQRVHDARTAAEDARQALIALRRRQSDGEHVTDDEIDAALDVLRDARASVTRAEARVGIAGRLEAPLASLPLQLKSFAFASGSKVLHGLLSGRDRARTAAIVSLLAGGLLSTWLKTAGSPAEEPGRKSRWDRMTWAEVAWEAFDNSSLGAWFADIPTSIDNVIHIAGEDRNPGLANEVGEVAGPGAGQIMELFEGMIGTGATGADIPDRLRVAQIRGSIPFGNILWWDGIMRRLERAAAGQDAAGELAAVPLARRGDRPGLAGRALGFGAPDLRGQPIASMPTPAPAAPDPFETDADDLAAAWALARKRSGHRGRHPRPPRPTPWAIASGARAAGLPLDQGGLDLAE